MSSPVIFKFSEIDIIDYATQDLIEHVTVAGQASFGFSPELAEQMTGPSNFPIETEVSTISTEGSITFRNYEKSLLEILMGVADEDTKASTKAVSTGFVGDVDNIQGSNLISDSGVFASVSAQTGSGANPLKSGVYRFAFTGTAGQWELKSLGSVDLRRTDYEDPERRIVKTGTLAVGTGDGLPVQALDDIGVNLTPRGTYAHAADNDKKAVVFRVFAPGERAYVAEIGQENLVIPKVKIRTLSRVMSDGRWVEFFAYNAIFPGLNVNFGDEFSENEISGKLIYDLPSRKVADLTYYQRA